MDGSSSKKLFSELTEREIIRAAQNGDRQAQEFLLENNLDIVYSKSRMFYIKGLDRDDVIQEGLVGLFKAIRDYCYSRGSSFRGFAHLCVNRQLISAIKTANRQKHKPLNSSASIDRKFNYSQDDGGRGRSLLDILADENSNPEKEFLNRELVCSVIEELKEILTPLEWKVFSSYLASKSYQEISLEIEGSVKTVDNALQRTRKKVSQLRFRLEGSSSGMPGAWEDGSQREEGSI